MAKPEKKDKIIRATGQEPGTIRLVLVVDVDADTIAEAYTTLYDEMERTDLDWQTTEENEWFEPTGEKGDPDVLVMARSVYQAILKKRNDGRPGCFGDSFDLSAYTCRDCVFCTACSSVWIKSRETDEPEGDDGE